MSASRILCLIVGIVLVTIAGFPWSLVAVLIIAAFLLIRYTLNETDRRRQQGPGDNDPDHVDSR